MPTYSPTKVAGRLGAWGLLAIFAAMLCLCLISAKGAVAANLTDISGHWAAAQILKAVDAGYVKGYPDGSFKPNAGVTRAEFVAMLDSAFQVPAKNYGHAPGDVNGRDWFAQDVQSALAAGFVNGYPDGSFRPQQEVSRQEAACMLAGLLKLDAGGEPTFSDRRAIATWAETSVSGLVAAGIMSGYPDGTFEPQKVITRAEAVVMINQALALQSLTTVSGQLQVTGDVVNVRSNPGDGSIIGQVHSGDMLQAKAKNGSGWYQIEYQGGAAWICGQYVQAYQPPAAPATNSEPAGSQASNSSPDSSMADNPVSPGSTQTPGLNPSQTANSSPSNSTEPAGTAGSATTEPSRDSQAELSVQVSQDVDGTTVDIQGAPDSTCTCTEEKSPQILNVTVTGISLVRTPSEIDIESGGLDKIITSVSNTVYGDGTATVSISFKAPVPLVYHTSPGGPGELLITVLPQIYQIEAGVVSNFVAVNLWGTAPLSYLTSQLTDPAPGLACDFGGFVLNPALQSWQKQLNALGITGIQVSQYNSIYQAYVVRLTVSGAGNIEVSSDTGNDGRRSCCA